MRRLICAFVVHVGQKQVFSWWGSYCFDFQVTLLLINFTHEEHNMATDEKRAIVDTIYQYNRRFSGEPRSVSQIFVCKITEPCHEIMVLFVLHKLILQTRMHSHPMGLDVWLLVWSFVYFHTSCVGTAKALGDCVDAQARLSFCCSLMW